MYDDIVEFAELEKFMDQKLKNYSSGMQVRLAFSIAIRAKGDILLLDEVLAVGDAIFQQKCFNYFHQLRKNNKTVLLVSHDVNVLRQYCSRGVLIENGRLVDGGPIDQVLNKYTDIVSEQEATVQSKSKTDDIVRHGTGRVKIETVSLKDEGGRQKNVFRDEDQSIVLEMGCVAIEDVEAPVYGITIKDINGSKVFTSNNLWLSLKAKNLSKGERQKVTWEIPNVFNTGELFISPAVADSFGSEVYDSVDEFIALKIRKKQTTSGVININHGMKFNG
jgi:ABC-2 type transport system ATP-binding protein